MPKDPLTKASENLLRSGVAVVGGGLMGSAYTTRLAALGVPVTVYNRTRAKAEALAKDKPGVTVAASLEDCAKRDVLLFACSPTLGAVTSLVEGLRTEGRLEGKHLVFILDAGHDVARYIDDKAFGSGGAKSAVFVAMFGSAFDVMKGTGGHMNVSGHTRSPAALRSDVAPLLDQFGEATYHEGSATIASTYAMAGHIAFLPIVYAQMHYQAMMERGGVDRQMALAYFQLLGRTIVEGYAPLLAGAYAAHDYSLFIASHGTALDILRAVSATAVEMGIDPRLSALMARYHEAALEDPRIAPAAFTSAYELIAPKR